MGVAMFYMKALSFGLRMRLFNSLAGNALNVLGSFRCCRWMWQLNLLNLQIGAKALFTPYGPCVCLCMVLCRLIKFSWLTVVF